MIYTDLRVPASGPKSAQLAVIGMSPAKNELADRKPFTGPSGRLLNEALATANLPREAVYVTNLCSFFIDDNDLYTVPQDIMDNERQRVFQELEAVRPNCLLILGADTIDLLTASSLRTTKAGTLETIGSRKGITKWRGSVVELPLPNGRVQKSVCAMHPASFIRGQWKWLPLFKYIDVPRAVTQSSSPDLSLTPRQAMTGPSFRTAVDFLREAHEQEWVSIDYEGTNHITCLGVGWTPSTALCIPLNRVGASSYWTAEEEIVLWKLWCSLLSSPSVKKIAQNASYEWVKSWQHGIYPAPLGIDTMHAHHCLYPDWGGISDEWTRRKRDIDNPGHGLALIASQYTDQPFYKDEGRHWRPEAGELAFWRYNALDVMVTYESAFKMMDELRHAGLWEVYQRNYLDQFEHTLRMEWFGIPIDIDRRESARLELEQELKTVTEDLQATLHMQVIAKQPRKGAKTGLALNLASPTQMKAFFAKRGYAIPTNRRTGAPKLDKDDLRTLAIKHSDDVIPRILRIREIQDLLNDVISQTLDSENRIHCHYRLGGTNGTRWSSGGSILGTGTNLQNLPRQGVARQLFLPQ